MLAYFDCFAGISGDMTLGAMIDLGLDPEYLRDRISRLGLRSYSLKVSRSIRRHLSGIRFEVDVHEHQPHRSYAQIHSMIRNSDIEPAAVKLALDMFHLIACAEAKVHGVDVEDVHFHEIGAVDSIVDIVGVALGVEALGITSVTASELPMSRGFVRTMHGPMPTPAPATLEILQGVPVIPSTAQIELVTPTGAAIVKCLASGYGGFPRFMPEKTGYGLGRSDPDDFPNALRIVLGKEHPSITSDKIAVLECQVDDLDPRVLGSLMELLLAAEALDVTYTAVQMKKNRPGTMIQVLAEPHRIAELAALLRTHTTTLGVRVALWDRFVAPRNFEQVETSLGEVTVKVVELPDGTKERRVEFDDASRIARHTGRPIREVLRRLERETEHR